MTADVQGPAWALEGLGVRSGRYPLSVEGPVMRAVDRLVPGMSTVTRYIRYHSMYAAIAADAERRGLDEAACRALVRRGEVLLAALGRDLPPGAEASAAHGIDRVRRFCGTALDLAGAADEEQTRHSYSPRRWGFWDQYGGPATVLGTVEVRDGALRPGRHACPAAVREVFAPLLALAVRDTVPFADLDRAAPVALGAPVRAEQEWLTGVFTATRPGQGHVPQEWEPSDRTRRATLRILGRAVELHGRDGDGYLATLTSAVAFGDELDADPVLAAVPEAQGWRGLLLRHYSVGAWRRLWASLVAAVGTRDGEHDRSAAELRDWLADQAPATTVRGLLAALPPLKDPAGRLLPAERELLARDGATPMTDVLLLLTGGLRSRPGHLPDDVRAVFLGRQPNRAEFLDPTWIDNLLADYRDRPARDLAARLVDDMLAQSRRVALAKLRTDRATGGLRIFSRLHLRDERYFRTGEESSDNIGTRIPQLGLCAEQLGLFTVEDDCYAVTAAGRNVLETAR
ncbi:hypothetical protein [Actinacidiphila sp. ITFR-21]|uniref:hypothetical protein n=1 Tax=Actinacidiphila sp. ITFR-21 TaxID=3075199 RepID=UPI00288B1C55|nr:hypothetical protein [Streptomyces sp. ITFR-21]WNI14840.1 hypothetical protein RLT57_04340 [Streptomyces sp. ITFR-21]